MKPPETISLDVDSMTYRGEGNSTLVIALDNRGKVLRLRKFPIDQPPAVETTIKTDLEHHIWFANNVLRKLISREMFAEPSLVIVSQKDMEFINSLWDNSRPRYRKCKKISHNETWALLLNDYCCLPPSPSLQGYYVDSVITVEIKPKQGFLPIIHNRAVNRCRFALKQALKLQSRRISEESHYCPLDLFSGCRTRMMNAIQNLLKTPQNNLKIFLDSHLVFSDRPSLDLDFILPALIFDPNGSYDEYEATEIFSNLIIQSLLHPLNDSPSTIYDPGDIESQKLCMHHDHPMCDDYTCGGFHKVDSKCVLAGVLKLQMLDTIGCYGASKIYNNLKRSSPEMISQLDGFKEGPLNDFVFPPKFFGSPSRAPQETEDEFQMRKLLQYLISSIAKDCSIMISLQRLEKTFPDGPPSFKNQSRFNASDDCQKVSQNDSENPTKAASPRCHIIYDQITDTFYAMSIAITDLDCKDSSKIPEVFKREKMMIEAFNDYNNSSVGQCYEKSCDICYSL